MFCAAEWRQNKKIKPRSDPIKTNQALAAAIMLAPGVSAQKKIGSASADTLCALRPWQALKTTGRKEVNIKALQRPCNTEADAVVPVAYAEPVAVRGAEAPRNVAPVPAAASAASRQ